MANLSSKTGTVTTPVQAQISLANNSTTTVQDMSAYDAQEVMGFVYIDATADLRCSFKVQVVKNGAGTYEIAAADVAGDQSGTGASAVAPVSFSMSGSILQATIPNISGFNAATSYLRYQLSAPYLGGNYPLTVSASQVAGNAAGSSFPAAGYIGEVKSILRTTATAMGASNVWIDGSDGTNSSITLTPGIWQISLSWYLSTQGGTITVGQEMDVGWSTTSGNSSAGQQVAYNSATWIYQTATATVSQYWSGSLPPVTVRCDGTNIYLPDGSSLSGTTIYWKLVHQTAGAVPLYRGHLRAVRIA